MKRMLACLLSLSLSLSAAAALAERVTHVETGEEVTYSDGTLRVYDRVVFEAKKKNPFRGIIIEDMPTPLAAMPIVVADMQNMIDSDEIISLRIVKLEHLVGVEMAEKLEEQPVTEQVSALLYLMHMAEEDTLSDEVRALDLTRASFYDGDARAFLLAPEIFPEGYGIGDVSDRDFAAGSVESRLGYLARPEEEAEKLAIVGISFEMVYDDSGIYTGLNEAQRTYVESYNFSHDAHDDGQDEARWGLVSVVRGVKGFVGGASAGK